MQPNNNQPLQLSDRGIEKMTKQINEQLVLQAINFKKKNSSSKVGCELSDGVYKIRAYFSETCKINPQDEGAIIQVEEYGLLAKASEQNQQQRNQVMGILVHICKIIDGYEETIGNPINIIQDRHVVLNENHQANPQIDKSKLRSYNKRTEIKKSSGPIEKTEPKGKTVTLVYQQSQPAEQLEEDYQKIEDLYTDLPNWQIIVKLTKKQLKEFFKNGKPIILLSLEFMDNTGMKIGGTIFGEAGKEYNVTLQEGQIYKVSKGQIRQDTYNANKNIPNHSKYTLMLTRNSEFKKLAHLKQQFEIEEKHMTLSEILSQPRLNQQYDIRAILIAIHDEVEIRKQTKTLIKQTIEIYDPDKQTTVEAIIWNRGVKLNQYEEYIGKVVALIGWRLGKFNDKWSFNSGYNSDIKVLKEKKRGSYEQYDSKLDIQEIKEINLRSKEAQRDNLKTRNVDDAIEEEIKYLKDIEREVADNEREVRSTICVFVSFLGYKNWYYESCPYCRKSAESQSKCPNCERLINQTIPKYKLNVELNDCSGSVWATGFDELGQKMFTDIDHVSPIKYLQTLDENERKSEFEKSHFKQFLMRITSKPDNRESGAVKHTINKVIEINVPRVISENFKKILRYQKN